MTIPDWFRELPYDVRVLVLLRAHANSPEAVLLRELVQMFPWTHTPEGFRFWEDVAEGREVALSPASRRVLDSFPTGSHYHTCRGLPGGDERFMSSFGIATTLRDMMTWLNALDTSQPHVVVPHGMADVVHSTWDGVEPLTADHGAFTPATTLHVGGVGEVDLVKLAELLENLVVIAGYSAGRGWVRARLDLRVVISEFLGPLHPMCQWRDHPLMTVVDEMNEIQTLRERAGLANITTPVMDYVVTSDDDQVPF